MKKIVVLFLSFAILGNSCKAIQLKSKKPKKERCVEASKKIGKKALYLALSPVKNLALIPKNTLAALSLFVESKCTNTPAFKKLYKDMSKKCGKKAIKNVLFFVKLFLLIEVVYGTNSALNWASKNFSHQKLEKIMALKKQFPNFSKKLFFWIRNNSSGKITNKATSYMTAGLTYGNDIYKNTTNFSKNFYNNILNQGKDFYNKVVNSNFLGFLIKKQNVNTSVNDFFDKHLMLDKSLLEEELNQNDLSFWEKTKEILKTPGTELVSKAINKFKK